ncbi:hypothetical protein FGG08_005307 [Glutinoglossum americanum]|uniref:Peptidase S8/S53 domain-containing protein n=1 Tax=Glutinoglossum americanum TaxID=1670608 RepID=A0A9P8KW64_9PEZI|nr:hypothetical protein FGG08_005307 [Glutinoglossum americanum]
MDFGDPFDLAQAAIPRVSDIASRLGVENKRSICGRLGGELLILANSLDCRDSDQEECMRLRIWKLLRDVERICTWPQKSEEYRYLSLLAIAEAAPKSTSYYQAESKIRQGLEAFTSESHILVEKFISHIRRFITHKGAGKSKALQQDTVPTRTTPADYPKDVNILLYSVLHEHTCCNCIDKEARKDLRRHRARLLLKSTRCPAEDGHIHFDMLFSSAPSCSLSRLVYWQDMQLLVPSKKIEKKRARFTDDNDGTPQRPSRKFLKQAARGMFCKLISLKVDSRLCLTIEDRELRQLEDLKPLEQILEHDSSVSLANVLESYHLTAKMKVTLAYILARSIWQFYDSSWMNTKWTGESIQFMRECRPDVDGGQGNLYAWKPYFSVRFGEVDSEFVEFSDADKFHRYPRVLALGIMLVEIGIGSPLRKREEGFAKMNDDWVLATMHSEHEEPWPDFDYSKYRTAVKNCLDRNIFVSAPFIPGQKRKEYQESLEQRRRILYDRVVFPLEELFHGTGWADELTTMGPMKSASRPPPEAPVLEPSQPTTSKGRTALDSQKKSKRWLSQVDTVSTELFHSTGVQNISPVRVKVAILDTGYDDDAPFFHSRRSRLSGWKDWVDASDEPQDSNGHGTHVVSLVMRTAPQALVYVARVAKDTKHLLEASENIAKVLNPLNKGTVLLTELQAVGWACTEWGADIISLSFGYAQEVLSISRAIRRAVNDRDDSILFFAAAANFGANEKEMFPARHESVISIRGTNTDGAFEDFNPPRNLDEGTVYGTLGLDVPSAWLRDHPEVMHKSGTSVATPIAAGMAAMLLGYVNGKSHKSTYQDVKRKLRTRRGMLAMFKSIAAPTMNEGYFYVAPWSLAGISDEVRWDKIVAAMSDVP